jgi:hypothetical protein
MQHTAAVSMTMFRTQATMLYGQKVNALETRAWHLEGQNQPLDRDVV